MRMVPTDSGVKVSSVNQLASRHGSPHRTPETIKHNKKTWNTNKRNIKQHHMTYTQLTNTNSYTAAIVREGVAEVRWHSRTKDMHER